jgi:hypothetical protein
VLWNEEPVAGAQVYATSEYTFSSIHFGEAATDAAGHFSIRGVPPGQKYLYAFGNGAAYWVSAVTPFVMPAVAGTVASDTYLCRGFDPISPARGESLRTSRPVLSWTPYPDAVDYAVRVIRTGQSTFVFSRGDQEARLKTTTAQVDVDLLPGEYTWRVDAFNQQGHIIGCSYYPRTFVISGEQAAPPPLAGAASLSPDIDPDHHIHGIPLGTSIVQFVNMQGQPTGEFHLSPSETVLLYGRSHAFYFEGDRLIGAWVRQAAFIVDFRLMETWTGNTRFDGLGWRLSNGIQSGMSLTEIKRMLGDKLLACAPGNVGLPRCYFTTDKARVEFDLLPRPSSGANADDSTFAVGVIVKVRTP